MNIKTYLKLSFITLILVLLQTGFITPLFEIRSPALIFLFPLALLSLKKTKGAYFSAFIGGLLFDFMGTGLLGKTSLIILALLVLVYYIKKYFFDNFFLYLLAIIIYSLVRYLVAKGALSFDPLAALLNFSIYVLFNFLLRKFDFSGMENEPRSLKEGY